jgi:hypothetical protein
MDTKDSPIFKYLSHLNVHLRLNVLSYKVSAPSPRYNFNESIVFDIKIENMETMRFFAVSRNYENFLEIGFNIFTIRVSNTKDYFSLSLLRRLVEQYKQQMDVFIPKWDDEIRVRFLRGIFENCLDKVCITFHDDIEDC